MPEEKRQSRIYFGWWMLLVNSVCGGVLGGFSQLSSSVLFKPIASDLGLSRAATAAGTAFGTLQSGITFPLTGWLADKFGPKWPIMAGIIIKGIGLVLVSFIDSAWSYYIVWGLMIALGQTMGFAIAADKMLTSWFIRKRGLAFGIKFAIGGILGVIVLPVVSWLLTMYSWRQIALMWAGLTFATFPIVWYFVRQKRPEYYGLLPDGARVESGPAVSTDAMVARGMEYAAEHQETEFTLGQAIRTASFWLLTLAWVAYQAVVQGFNVHIVPFLTDRGIDPVVAAGMMAMMVFFTIPSRFLGGVIADRIGKDHLRWLLVGTFLAMAIGVSAFVLWPSGAMIYPFFILWGLGSGAFVPTDIVIRSRYFGRKAYGAIQGGSFIFSAPMGFLAPIYVGRIYDVTQSYAIAFTLFAAVATLGALALCFMRAPKQR